MLLTAMSTSSCLDSYLSFVNGF
uniref:Uncharacterized protein n=1 Tax=Arundo donax TaxID=35708 RepID=A0A0A9FSB4_ARUDO